MAVVTSVVRVQQIFLHRIDRVLRPMGLSFARYEVLMLLLFSRAGALPLGKLGARLQVQPGAVTNAVDRLEADGLVVRRSHPSDGRTTLAAITDRGRRLAVEATDGLNERVFATVDVTAERDPSLFSLLREIRVAHGDFESH
jgi:DNA-binding MarR family transcriptional regulator